MDRTATCFVLIVTLAVLAAANIVAQQTPSTKGQNLQLHAGGEETVSYARGVYCAGVVLFNLRRRNSIAQSAAMVSRSLMM